MIIYRDSYYKAARLCLWMFISFVFISFLYVIITKTYNGDFYGIPVRISIDLLIFNLLLSIAPYFFTWFIYIYFKQKKTRQFISVPVRFWGIFMLAIILWNIFITINYGVGIMGKPIYDAPSGIRLIIQILNRIDYLYGSLLYILLVDKKNKTQILFVLLMILLAYLRAGLGIFLYLGLVYILKYYDEIISFTKRRIILVVFIIIIFPVTVSYLYSLRTSLRTNQERRAYSSEKIITGRLIGRLSSYSNSAMVLQEKKYFISNIDYLKNFYYEQQAIAGIFGVGFMPDKRPEYLLINVHGGDIVNSSFMVGIPGNCYIAGFKSPVILLVNLVFTILMIICVFSVMSYFNIIFAAEFALILLLYPLTSGVSNEFSKLAFSLFVFFIIFVVSRFFIIYLNKNKLTKTND
jgi:hypothetical protein